MGQNLQSRQKQRESRPFNISFGSSVVQQGPVFTSWESPVIVTRQPRWAFTGTNALLPWQHTPALSRLKDPLLLQMSQGSHSTVYPTLPRRASHPWIKTSYYWPFSCLHLPPNPHINRSQWGRGVGGRHTVISPFIALLISSQDATINIELQWWLLLCCSLQVRTQAHTPGLSVLYIGGGGDGVGEAQGRHMLL